MKEHQNSLPVSSVAFHSGDGTSSGRRVLSSDGKVVKLWSRGGAQGVGATLANIETQATVNDLTVATDARGDSGLLLMAAEQSRVLSYYVPALGPAPRWCSFLDVITEEVRHVTLFVDPRPTTHDPRPTTHDARPTTHDPPPISSRRRSRALSTTTTSL